MFSRFRSSPLSRLTLLGSAVGLVAGTFVATVGVDAAAAKPAERPRAVAASTVFTVSGRGWGHGHGMSQWGAQGAAKKGKSYAQILGFYYPHTRWGRAGGRIRVRIVADTSRDVVVAARSGLRAEAVRSGRTWNLAAKKPKATRWKIVPASGGRSVLLYQKGGWHRLKTIRGELQFDAGGRAIRLYLPHGASAKYRGVLRSAAPRPKAMNRDTVNILSLDNYLRSVVPSEAYPSWKPAALKAQAVAARTYAAYQRAHSHGYYDVVDTTGDQAYHGTGVETASTTKAVTATSGRIRTYGGKAAYTQFSASNGGFLLAGGKPYLVSKKDPYDTRASGDTNLSWSTKITARQLMRRFTHGQAITAITAIKVAGTGGRYMKTVAITYGSGHVNDVPADTFRAWAGLKSTWFSIR